MEKALFLDRDGVVNIDFGYVYKIEDFIFCDGIFDLLKAAMEKNYLIIIVTNQSGIARGIFSEDDFIKLNGHMLRQFEKRGITVNMVYHCPYHPCNHEAYMAHELDRKPHPGMFQRAQKDFGLDISQCIAIGDKISDIKAAKSAGVEKCYYIKTRYPLDGAAITVNSLYELAEIIKTSE